MKNPVTLRCGVRATRTPIGCDANPPISSTMVNESRVATVPRSSRPSLPYCWVIAPQIRRSRSADITPAGTAASICAAAESKPPASSRRTHASAASTGSFVGPCTSASIMSVGASMARNIPYL